MIGNTAQVEHFVFVDQIPNLFFDVRMRLNQGVRMKVRNSRIPGGPWLKGILSPIILLLLTAAACAMRPRLGGRTQ
jgi:hypothetical protein